MSFAEEQTTEPADEADSPETDAAPTPPIEDAPLDQAPLDDAPADEDAADEVTAAPDAPGAGSAAPSLTPAEEADVEEAASDTATAAPSAPLTTLDADSGLSAAERELQAALAAAAALGIEPSEGDSSDSEDATADRLVSELGLDQPVVHQEPSTAIFDEPEEEAADEEAAEEEDELFGPDIGDGRAWYAINTYTGHENRVNQNLERRVKNMDVEDQIFRVVVPTEKEVEIRGGKRKEVQRKLLPGYVLVQMILDENTWHVVRNTPGVTGFVGADQPNPLPSDEVKSILQQMRVEEPRVRVGFEIEDSVRVANGPFQDFIGQVDEINMEKGKVRVLISMFGRETPVELDFDQVEKT